MYKLLSKNRLALIALLQLNNKMQIGDVANIWSKYETGFQSTVKCNGPRYTLEIYKACYVFLRNRSLQLPTHPIPFCKHDSIGIPKPLWPLRPLIKGNRDCIRLALTIARTYELITLPIDYSVKSIIEPSQHGKKFEETTEQFYQFLEKFVHKYPWYLGRLQTRDTNELRVSTTLSKGPNGSAVSHAHLDAQAVMKDTKLYKSITELNDALGQSWVTRWMEKQGRSFNSEEEYITGRLGFSAEPGGKTRIFAIGDYWSQTSLKVIQDSLYSTLRSISTDSTADQQKGFKTLLIESRGKDTYCFDLSSASDRIPAVMQKKRLELMGGKKLGDAWYKVMTDRTFLIKATGESVRWSVGQPLGLLSSFPSFSLWHHDIVQFAANYDRIKEDKPLKFFKEYRILGDDVVIFNKKAAVRYQYLITEVFGISINLSKSVIGEKGQSQIEFTKRLALEGLEMSSIKTNILSKSNLQSMLDLIDIMFERDFISTNTGFYKLSSFMRHEERRKLEFMVWVRSHDTLPFKGDDESFEISRESFWQRLKEKRSENIKQKLTQLDDYLMGNTSLDILYKRAAIPYSERALGLHDLRDSWELHPLVWAVNQTGLDLSIALSLIWDDSTDVYPVEYLPMVSNKSFFNTPRKEGAMWLSSLFLEIFDELRNET